MTRPADLKGYFAEARGWNADRLANAERSRRVAWTIAGAASLLTLAAVGAVAMLAPLKTVEPFVVRVEEATGQVEVMSALSTRTDQTYDEAVTKHFLAQYVRAREGWLAPAAEADFRQVSIMSTPAEQQRFATLWRASNPQSPQNLHGPGGEVQVTIRAIAFLAKDVASVRFHRSLRQGQAATGSDWIATLAFAYTAAPMAEADRLKNPLGFQVTSYRADPEVTP